MRQKNKLTLPRGKRAWDERAKTGDGVAVVTPDATKQAEVAEGDRVLVFVGRTLLR